MIKPSTHSVQFRLPGTATPTPHRPLKAIPMYSPRSLRLSPQIRAQIIARAAGASSAQEIAESILTVLDEHQVDVNQVQLDEIKSVLIAAFREVRTELQFS